MSGSGLKLHNLTLTEHAVETILRRSGWIGIVWLPGPHSILCGLFLFYPFRDPTDACGFSLKVFILGSNRYMWFFFRSVCSSQWERFIVYIDSTKTVKLSFLQNIQVVKETIDSSATIEFRPNTADDPHMRKPDISKAKELLNWEPKVSLREGLPLMVSDFQNRILNEDEGKGV